MENSIPVDVSDIAAFLASPYELPKLVEKRSPLEKSKIYQDFTFELLKQCQLNSSSGPKDVEEEINRIKNYFEELHLSRRSFEQAKWTLNPKKIYKRHRRHLQLAGDSLKLLTATRNTSDSILRRMFMSSEQSLISTTASFFTAVDCVTQNDMDPEDDNNDHAPNLETIHEDQSEDQVVAQVQGFTQAFQEMPTSQTSNLRMNQYVFYQSVVHQGSGPSTNSSVIVGGSNNRGGGSQHITSPT